MLSPYPDKKSEESCTEEVLRQSATKAIAELSKAYWVAVSLENNSLAMAISGVLDVLWSFELHDPGAKEFDEAYSRYVETQKNSPR